MINKLDGFRRDRERLPGVHVAFPDRAQQHDRTALKQHMDDPGSFRAEILHVHHRQGPQGK